MPTLYTAERCPYAARARIVLAEKGIAYGEYSLVQPPGKAKIRKFIRHVKRDDKGAIILPTLVLNDQGIVRAVLNSPEELDLWLRSKG